MKFVPEKNHYFNTERQVVIALFTRKFQGLFFAVVVVVVVMMMA